MFLRKRESTYRLLTAGFFIIIVCSWCDVLGTTLGKWHYNFDVIPMLPSYAPWDFTVPPVLAMSLIQYKPHIHPTIKAVIFGGVSAFGGEPIAKWLRIYDSHNWKHIHIYSFVIFVLIYLIAHFISSRKTFEEIV